MDEFNDLELELKRLQPSVPSAELKSRIAAALTQEVSATATAGVLPQRRRARINWLALGLGTAAAAAAATFAVISFDRSPRGEQTSVASNSTPIGRESPAATVRPLVASSFVPDGLTRVVYHTRDEGLVYHSKTDAPVRRFRSRARETLQWKEAGTGASLRVSYPTEEVELIPVSGQ